MGPSSLKSATDLLYLLTDLQPQWENVRFKKKISNKSNLIFEVSALSVFTFTYLQTDGRRSSCVAHKTATSNDDLSDSEVTTTPAPGGPNDPAVRGHLKIVVSKRDRRCDDDEDDEEGEGSVVSDEWKLIASIMDRLLFVLFLCISSVSSFTILVVRPLMKPSIHLE